MRIDAHHHVWDLDVRDQPWTAELPALRRSFTIDELRPSLDRHRIDATVVVQTVCVAEETPELLAMAASDPAIAGVVGWVDLTAPDVGETLAELRRSPGGELLVGIRHQVQEEPDPWYLARPDVRRGLRAVADAGLVFDLLIRPQQLAAAVDTVRALPDARFVLDHAGKPNVAAPPSTDWLAGLGAFGALANVAIKISGMTSEAPPGWTPQSLQPFADALLASVGPGRLMFGSDWPACLLGGGYDATFAATEAVTVALSDPERDLLFGAVAVSTYSLRR
jgi:L-fuconolactonase